MAGPDYIVDIDGLSQPVASGGGKTTLRGRPWLAIHWKCCSTYSRIYRNREATAYEGRCPRCQKPVSVHVGPGGTHARMFEAS